MIDYEQKIHEIIDSITNISFEFDFEKVKKEMELQEVPKIELEKLGEQKIQENFNVGIFKIQLPNNTLIDVNSIQSHIKEKGIKEPVIFINPDFKYVQWVVKKDFTTPQIKKKIRQQLSNNTKLDISEVQKALINEDVKNKKVEGYVGILPIKTSNYIKEGQLYIQSSCSRDSAIRIIDETINELKLEAYNYINNKIKQHRKYLIIYFVFILFISLLWLLNKQCQTLPFWLSNSIGLILFLVSLVVMRLINHSIFDVLLFRKKTEKKFEKEFYEKLV